MPCCVVPNGTHVSYNIARESTIGALDIPLLLHSLLAQKKGERERKGGSGGGCQCQGFDLDLVVTMLHC
eukprot:1029357-Rhodomonas_salina.1